MEDSDQVRVDELCVDSIQNISSVKEFDET